MHRARLQNAMGSKKKQTPRKMTSLAEANPVLETSAKDDQCIWRKLLMVDRMQHLLDTGFMSDCTFVVGKDDEQAEHIQAHKLLLSVASEVFHAMFTGGLQETGDVRVTDINADIFKIMLRYVYTERIELRDVNTALQVMVAANKYLMLTLVDKCVNFISSKMQPADVCQVFEVANLIGNQQLKQACDQMIKKSAENILAMTPWVNCSSTFLLTLLQQDNLNVRSELPLLIACQQWARHHVDDAEKKTLRDDMLPLLRLRTLTTAQFVEATQEDYIFTAEESRQILRCIINSTLKMPLGLCEVATARVDLYTYHDLDQFRRCEVFDEYAYPVQLMQPNINF